MKLFSILAVYALSLAPAYATDCAVAVCDIPAKIAEMREKNQDFRFETVSFVKKSTRASKNLDIHQNVVDFAVQALALSNELGDESWMVGECQSLLDQGRMGLIKYAPVNSAEMLKIYEQQIDEDSHFESLAYWRTQLVNIERLDVIRDLIRFAVGASEISQQRNEPDYIYREAITLAREATDRFALLDTSHEGDFKASLKVPNVGAVDYRLVVLETSGNSGLAVGLINAETGLLTYLFTNATFNFDLTELRADSTYDGYTARFVLRFDAVRGTYNGWIRDTRYAEDIGVEASLVRSPGEYLKSGSAPKPITLRDLEGQYEGKIGDLEGILIVKRFGQRNFAAAFETKDKDGSLLVLKFQTGSYNATAGVLTLVNNVNDSLLQKLTLAYRENAPDDVHAKFVGFNYGMNNFDPQDAAFIWKGPVSAERSGPNWPLK